MEKPLDTKTNVESVEKAKSQYPNAGEIVKLTLAALLTAGIVEYADQHGRLDAMYEQMEEAFGCSREASRTMMRIEEVVTLTIGGAIGLIMMRREEAAKTEKKRTKEAATP